MTTEEKFHAAVNVIRNLPKNGAYQPSHDLKLRFYAYFKQATEGPCNASKPAFWDVVGKLKWDAWKKLGNMPKHEAMNNYVEELKKIVETMSYNDNIGTFLGSLGSFYDSVPVEDIEMLLGPVLERVRSQPGSPLHGSPFDGDKWDREMERYGIKGSALKWLTSYLKRLQESEKGSRETSPTRVPRELVNKRMSSLETSPISSMSPSPQPPDTDDEDEEFIDTVETTPHTSRKSYRSLSNSPVVSKRNIDLIENSNPMERAKTNGHVTSPQIYTNHSSHNGSIPQMNGNGLKNEAEESIGVNGTKPRNQTRESPNVAKRRIVKQNGGLTNSAHVTDLSEPIREVVLHLQKDLDRITARVRSLEVSALSQPQYFYAEASLGNNVDSDVLEVDEIVLTPVGSNVVAKRYPRWWPFRELSPKAAFFVIIWPFVAHFLIRYMQNRRRRY